MVRSPTSVPVDPGSDPTSGCVTRGRSPVSSLCPASGPRGSARGLGGRFKTQRPWLRARTPPGLSRPPRPSQARLPSPLLRPLQDQLDASPALLQVSAGKWKTLSSPLGAMWPPGSRHRNPVCGQGPSGGHRIIWELKSSRATKGGPEECLSR